MYNILFKHILRGQLAVYYPYDPNWFSTSDKGYLHFPVNAENFSSEKNKVYSNDSILKVYLRKEQILGCEDYSYNLVPMQSRQYPGEDSISASGDVVYYEREFVWYIDKDIIGFKLREELIMDENGSNADRKIKALAPIVNARGMMGEIVGTKELFWLDFEELDIFLKNYYVLLDGIYERKVKSFSQIFKERIFISNVIEQDSSFVTPSK